MSENTIVTFPMGGGWANDCFWRLRFISSKRFRIRVKVGRKDGSWFQQSRINYITNVKKKSQYVSEQTCA